MTTQLENINKTCATLYALIFTFDKNTPERRFAIKRWQDSNRERSEIKRAIRLAR